MDALAGWLGAALLVLGGWGWGQTTGGSGVTAVRLAVMVAASGLGLLLAAFAFLRGVDAPLVVGILGALGASVAAIFGRRDGE